MVLTNPPPVSVISVLPLAPAMAWLISTRKLAPSLTAVNLELALRHVATLSVESDTEVPASKVGEFVSVVVVVVVWAVAVITVPSVVVTVRVVPEAPSMAVGAPDNITCPAALAGLLPTTGCVSFSHFFGSLSMQLDGALSFLL